jgi:DNA-binding response OmpR family regulator
MNAMNPTFAHSTVPMTHVVGHGFRTQRSFGIYVFRMAFDEVRVHGKAVRLTRREFELALMLFTQMGDLLSRASILDALWQNDDGGSSRSLDTHICRIRKSLDIEPANGFVLSTIYRRGYRLEAATPANEAVYEYATTRRR